MLVDDRALGRGLVHGLSAQRLSGEMRPSRPRSLARMFALLSSGLVVLSPSKEVTRMPSSPERFGEALDSGASRRPVAVTPIPLPASR
jgi:hypothetical protein